MATEIKKAPDKSVTGLGVSRTKNGSYNIVAKWNVPAALTSDKSDRRATGVHIMLILYCRRMSNGGTVVLKHERKIGIANKECTFTLDGDPTAKPPTGGIKCNDGKTYYRKRDFYPVGDLRILNMRVSVRPYNAKGYGAWATVTRGWQAPRDPTVRSISMNESGVVTATVAHDAGEDWHDNRWTYITLVVWSSRSGKNISSKSTTLSRVHETGTISVDLKERFDLKVGERYTAICKAQSRGLYGNSEWVERRFYVSLPAVPVINGVDCSSKSDGGRVVFKVDLKPSKTHPVTGVKLQALRNSDVSKASQIPGEAWEQAADFATDNGSCTALAAMVEDLRSSDGLRTWVRLKTWNINEDWYFTYSAPRRIDELFTEAPSAAKDTVAIASATPSGPDSVDLILAFNSDGDDGTEVTWSDDADAWRSNKTPELFLCDWYEATPITVGSKTYARQAILHVRDLSEGTTYYFRARRYLEADEPTYGPYDRDAGYWQATPVSAPDSVSLAIPPYTPRGTDAQLSWTFGGDASQSEWQLITGETRVDTDDDGKEHVYIRGDDEAGYPVTIVASGTDSRGAYVLPWSRLEELLDDGDLPLAVRVGTGGELVCSEAVTLRVAEAPTLSISAQTVTSRPLVVSMACSDPCQVAIVCEAHNVSGDTPSGVREQHEGDCVWTNAWLPDWEAVTEEREEGGETVEVVTGYECEVEAPLSAELWDGGTYQIRAVATDQDTGMSSSEAACEVSVGYARKSPGPPEDGVAVTPYDQTDPDTGWRTRGCRVTLPDSDEALAPVVAFEGEWRSWEATESGAQITNGPFGSLEEGDLYTVVLRIRNNESADVGASFIEIPVGSALSADPSLKVNLAEVGETGIWSYTAEAVHMIGATIWVVVCEARAGADISLQWRVDVLEGEYPTGGLPLLVDGDVYDVYRVTPDGYDLVADGVTPGTVVDDQFAPFGNDGTDLAYRVAVRTVDGCEEWADFPYELDGDDLRVDWDGGYAELPYDISLTGQWDKPFDRRRHKGGGIGHKGSGIEGYWDEGVAYDEGLSTDLLKVGDPRTARSVRELGAHCGPVLVRTPDGRCYDADVEVREYGLSYDSGWLSVSLDAARIDLTEAHMATLPMPDETYAEDDEEAET